MEEACIAARVPNCPYHGAVAPQQNPDHVVFTVGDEQIFLRWVVRKYKVVIGAHSDRLRVDQKFLHEFAFFCKDLNPVVGSIANVNKPIIREMDAMDGIPEQFDRSLVGNVAPSEVFIAWRIAVGAPHPLEGSRLRVDKQ